ncbi:MAG: aminopeptidase P N-terminal domain-containing protein [Bdellovibrionales bacterium]|nr:aminopeptidase P N-terminal domain-containing protein [Bdellovibrionales bacterium]
MLKVEVSPRYAERRNQLMRLAPEACFIFFGAPEPEGSAHRHPFRQNSDFFYLTEFDEPGAILVLCGGKSHLFVSDRNEAQEIWTGERYGAERAGSVFQMDEASRVMDFDSKLDLFLKDSKTVYYSLGTSAEQDSRILKAIQHSSRHRGKGRFGNLPIHDPRPHLSLLRSVKDELEIERMRKACAATAKAHLHLLKRVKAGMSEFDAANEFQYWLFKNGCTDLGYAPIFASGFNATTLHYVRNNDTLKHGDLLLVDAAGEFGGYTADLTQTFPVSGTFTPEQRKIYQSVLDVNREITRMARPGVNYRSLHSKSVELLTGALLELGVLQGELKENVNTQAYRSYFPHGLGHYLGLDVHDVGIYHEEGRDFELKPGMILTNEPGLYFRERGTPFFGIGVRIEDDLLITSSGAEVLTHETPRDIDAIEALRTIANS